MKASELLTPFAESLHSAHRVWVGFSGGLDSSLLLKASVQLLGAEKVGALHLNHQIDKNSAGWEQHCSAQAKELGVEFRSRQVKIENLGSGIENQARELRYEFFEDNIGHNELLLLAHHADDQAETLLYRLMRGTGVRGLTGIPESRPLGAGTLLRPLLSIPREQLKVIAEEQGVLWIEDPSNSDTRYDRNYIRNQIRPVIEDRWPSATKAINQVASNMGSALQLQEEYGRVLFERCRWRKEAAGYSFDIGDYLELSSSAQNLVLETGLRAQGLSGFDSQLHERAAGIIQSSGDGSPLLAIANTEIRRFANRLYLMPKLSAEPEAGFVCIWDGIGTKALPNCGSVSLAGDYSGPSLRLTFRQGGESCHPLDRGRSQSLKKLFQEYELEPWLRSRAPLVWLGEELVGVAGLFSCSKYLPLVELDWQLN